VLKGIPQSDIHERSEILNSGKNSLSSPKT